LDEVLTLLSGRRLITLTGAGGSGKTRLALQAAGLARAIFPDGAWLVELATVSDPALVPQTVAATLAVRENPDKPIADTLVQYLQPLKLLLVLDNCEHLVGACADLARILLRVCPDLTILATSRQGLNIDGEVCWRVPSLSMPNPQAIATPDDLERYEAVQLFVDRAKQRRSDFELTRENAQAVAQLCYRLDGIPLAIELAAARIGVLSVEQIVERLDERFRLLASPNRGSLHRHQTLKAMIDWSYDLLSGQERALFRALSVFAGGFTFDAVPQVVGAALDEYEAIELLSQLVDKSLVMVDEKGKEARYHVLDTLRQYAWRKAVDEGESGGLQERHLAWCVSFAEQTEDELVGKDQAEWLDRLDKEHDNMRAALAYATERQPAVSAAEGTNDERPLRITHYALQLAGALVWYWYFRGFLSEGRRWLEGALAAAEHPERDVALAKALSAAGVLAYLQSDYPIAHDRLETSLSIWHELGDKRGTAFALTFLGRVLAVEGDPLRQELGERSVELFREINDKWGLALSLDFLGEEAREAGQADMANALHEESLSLYRIVGHSWGIALELSHFAQVWYSMGDYAEAHRRLEEAVEMQRAVGDKSALAWSLDRLGDILMQEGDFDKADATYRECFDLFRELEHRSGMAASLRKRGRVALRREDFDLAWTLTSQNLDLNRELVYRPGIIDDLAQLGEISQRRAQYVYARSLYREALTHARALGDRSLTAACIKSIAGLAATQQDWEQAAVLFGVAGKAAEGNSGAGMHVPAGANAGPADVARATLGESAYEALYRRGRALPTAEGISLALHSRPDDGQALSRPATQDGNGAEHDIDDLTRREIDMLKLIAEGLTDAQVADRLVLSARTVQAHARSIYSKLNITTRSAATRYAIKRGIV
jgi:non-specific serine/threonine protein kinase